MNKTNIFPFLDVMRFNTDTGETTILIYCQKKKKFVECTIKDCSLIIEILEHVLRYDKTNTPYKMFIRMFFCQSGASIKTYNQPSDSIVHYEHFLDDFEHYKHNVYFTEDDVRCFRASTNEDGYYSREILETIYDFILPFYRRYYIHEQ